MPKQFINPFMGTYSFLWCWRSHKPLRLCHFPSIGEFAAYLQHLHGVECPVDEKSSLNEKTEQKYLEQDSISLAENECRVNLANLYNLARGNDEYHLPSHKTNVVQKQRLNFLIHYIQNNSLILGHGIVDVGLEDQVQEANFFSLTGQITLLAFFPQDRQVFFIFFHLKAIVPFSEQIGLMPVQKLTGFRTLVLTLPIQRKA